MSGRVVKPLVAALISLNASLFGLQYYYTRPLSPRVEDPLSQNTSSWSKISQSDPLRGLRDRRLTDPKTTINDLIIQNDEHGARGPIYKLSDSPGKGMGLFATEAIPIGGKILEEYNVIACGNEGEKGGWKFGPRDLQSFVGQVMSLSPQLQRDMFKLQGKQVLSPPLMSYYGKILREEVYCADGSRLSWRESLRLQDALRIFYTNAATLYEPDSTWCLQRPVEQEVGDGLFLTFSRINHSCEPNAAWDTGRKAGVMEVRARRQIQAGEEITISYIGQLDRPVAERRSRLRRWGFDCQCK
ncbi:SET domain-containing protein [Cryphonectria parasitica EP155]|uniref:SET domain-containing protein n=1 Tax=Cryphonectria parasitica (strain ATCC 38755 / EP155) TaxID=660469 RepID=A0A9P4Y3D5_CRYP1|nr:SET domain-containing protein [Cryphonectria parasitica EP155]KAF3765715.1 SET domain-containing protein [Cryphonectria parasitica EP155]